MRRLSGAIIVVSIAVVASMCVGTAAAQSSDTVSVSIDNVGSSAWEVTSQDEMVADTGVNNPTLNLEVGKRYEFQNGGWSSHPFAILNESGSQLLSQSTDGKYENDPDVNWTDNGDTFAFTLTEELAAEVARYRCNIHTGFMNGEIQTTAFDLEVELQQTAEVSEGGSVTVTASVNNVAGSSATNVTTELLVDQNGDGKFSSAEVVTSTVVDYPADSVTQADLTYTNVQISPGEYSYQARVRKAGQTTESFTNGTLNVTAGGLSDTNPFGDASGEPLGLNDAANVLFSWNQNGEVNGVQYDISQMADFLFRWNQARQG